MRVGVVKGVSGDGCSYMDLQVDAGTIVTTIQNTLVPRSAK